MPEFIYEVTNRQPWPKTTTAPEVVNNIEAIAAILGPYMTREALTGIISNMIRESSLNPGQIQMSGGTGHGLIQWTPGTVIMDYATSKGRDWFDGRVQCQRILEELQGIEEGWLKQYDTSKYHRTFTYTGAEFMALTNYEEATRAYYAERERGANYDGDMVISLGFAPDIYRILGGITPGPVVDMDIIIYKKAISRRRKEKGLYG